MPQAAMTEPVRTIAIIGATSGLGRAAAGQLAHHGHRLILVGRDPERVRRLARQLPAAVIGADVSTSAGVSHTAAQISNTTDHLDALVNNAGVMIPTRQVTSEGIELNFAVHHLAPYSMTSKLLPLLARGAGRVVNVNAVHPGMVRTDLGRHWPRIQVAAMHAMSISARKGAAPVVSLATAPAVEPGAYYNRFTATRSSPESYDDGAARRLWEVSEALRGPFSQ